MAAAGCLTVLAGLTTAPSAQADPPPGSPEAKFIEDMSRNISSYIRPDDRVAMAHLACQVRRDGGDNDAAKQALFVAYYKKGIMNSYSEELPVLIHFAVKDLCPEVGDVLALPHVLD